MSKEEPVLIKMRGELGEIEMTIPHTYVAYYVSKDTESRLMATVNVAISAYKALKTHD